MVDEYGKELERLARLKNHHFNVRCYKSGITSPSLRVKAPVDTERARAAAVKVSRIFTQERIKTSWKARETTSFHINNYQNQLNNVVSSKDFEKIDQLCR